MSQVTRDNFGLNYQGYDASQPFPVGIVTERRNATYHRPLIRGGFQAFGPAMPRLMMDPTDPATWQRQYVFTD